MAALMLAASVAAFAASFGLPPPALEPIGPAAFPRATAIILFFLTALVLAGAFRRAAAPEAPAGYRRRYDLLVVLVAATVAYAGMMQMNWLGFRVATVIYVFALSMVLFSLKVRYLLPSAAIALVMGVAVHWLFTSLLYVDLP
jgi:hypothetical protein